MRRMEGWIFQTTTDRYLGSTWIEEEGEEQPDELLCFVLSSPWLC